MRSPTTKGDLEGLTTQSRSPRGLEPPPVEAQSSHRVPPGTMGAESTQRQSEATETISSNAVDLALARTLLLNATKASCIERGGSRSSKLRPQGHGSGPTASATSALKVALPDGQRSGPPTGIYKERGGEHLKVGESLCTVGRVTHKRAWSPRAQSSVHRDHKTVGVRPLRAEMGLPNRFVCR